MTDSTDELFSYFKITHEQFVGDIRLFKHNFSDPENQDHAQRLNYRLQGFIYRRTHNDTFLGKPLITLPQAKEIRIQCIMTPFEDALYRFVVEKRSARIINSGADKKKKFEEVTG